MGAKRKTASAKSVKARLYKNRSKTAEEAPYLAKVVPNATLDFDGFVAELHKSMPGRSCPEIAMVIREMIEVISGKLREGCRVETPFGTFEPHITGSADHADSPFDPLRNEVVVKITPPREWQKKLAKLDVEVVDAPTSDLALNGVETSSLGRAGVDVVAKGEPFTMTGRGFQDGALSARIVDSAGVAHPLGLTMVKSLYAQATAPTDLAVGTARLILVLTDAEGVEFSVSRKMTVVE